MQIAFNRISLIYFIVICCCALKNKFYVISKTLVTYKQLGQGTKIMKGKFSVNTNNLAACWNAGRIFCLVRKIFACVNGKKWDIIYNLFMYA